LKELVELLLSPALAAAVVAGVVSYVISRRSTYINSVTVERTKWIGELRANIARLSGQILTINQKQVFDRSFAQSPQFHQYQEGIHRLTSLIKLQLNPFNTIDKNILQILNDLESSFQAPHTASWAGNDYLLISHAQWLLKAEWDKVRMESAGPLRKLYLYFRIQWRARQYRKFVEAEGPHERAQVDGP
jgi:hypothetical protein